MANKKLSESIALLEQSIIDYEMKGNKRAANCARMVLKRLKKSKDHGNKFPLNFGSRCSQNK